MLQEDYPLICHQAFIAAKLRGITSVLSSERTYVPESRYKRFGLRLFDRLYGWVIREKVDLYTAHCSAAKKFLKEVVGVGREIEVVHVGINNEVFCPTEPAGLGDREDIKILCVARLTKYKGLEYLIRAVKAVKDELNVGLYIMGRGEDYGTLKNLVERLELSCVNFVTETVPNEDMPAFYSSCDIYSQPSIIEPYGIAVLEAMACGKPVIGTNVGGMLDTIVHGKTGFRAQPGNSDEIAEYIMLLEDDRLRKKVGRNAKRRAEKFDWIKIGKKYLKLVEALEKEI
jgi:glycosyltransferase involved in cell wall biosynthesis